MIVIASVTVMAHIYTENLLQNDCGYQNVSFLFLNGRNIIGCMYWT